MKVAVYAQSTLELLAVVDMDRGLADIGVERGYIEFAVAPDLADLLRAPMATTVDASYTVQRYSCGVKVLQSGGARTIALFVKSRDELSQLRKVRGLKQLWPRAREKNRGYRSSKAHKRSRAVMHRLPYPVRP